MVKPVHHMIAKHPLNIIQGQAKVTGNIHSWLPLFRQEYLRHSG
jgi:hypothetical protein